MRYLILLFVLVISFSGLMAQENESFSWQSTRVWFNLDSALAHPDSVYKLDLSDQNLQEFPKEIFRLTNLRMLNLSNNRLKSLPPRWEPLSLLEVLMLNDNQLREVPVGIQCLPWLQQLWLGENKIRSLPDWLCHLKKLRWIHLEGNPKSVINEVEQLKDCLPEYGDF